VEETSFILASRSPRRRELLGLIVPLGKILVVPPRDATEAGFEGLHDLPSIECRLAEIARGKAADVAGQLVTTGPQAGPVRAVVIAADTTIVATAANGDLNVLGQPPDDEFWSQTVRHWFRHYYDGRTHLALTALCVRETGGAIAERLVKTEVTFIPDVERHLEWYIGTGEPRGKAGGYAIQGAGSIFISKVAGSLTNVVGLPLEALLEIFEELQIDTERRISTDFADFRRFDDGASPK
jgi:septum formation protein